MSRSKSISGFLWFLLIPLISMAVWSYYYGIDRKSYIELVKLLLPFYIGTFIVLEFLIWAAIPKLSKSFRFGFLWGLFLLSPFYIWQIAFQFNYFLGKLPYSALYVIYGLAALIASISLGLIIWVIHELVFKVRKSKNVVKVILWRLVIAFACLVFLFPMVGRNRAAQPSLAKQRVSYRAYEKRELPQKPLKNVIVLGIDGGDWQVIEPLVKDGKLPAFKRFMSEGRWGTLISLDTLRSPSIWTTMFTGQPPKVHGIEDWNVSYSKNRLVKGIWNILSEYDLRTTMVNVPATFPPEEIVGKEISGFPYPNQTLNAYGWICSTEKVNAKITPEKPLEIKLQQDGSYKGTISVSDTLMDKYNAGMRGKVFKNIIIEMMMRTRQNEVYGEVINIADFKYLEREEKIELYSLKGEQLIDTISKDDPDSKFFEVQIAPGVVAKIRITLVRIENKKVVLYVTPFLSVSEKPRYQYTFPETLAKDIHREIGIDQYIVEMTWTGSKDLVILPAIKDFQFYAESTRTKVGEYLFDERQWDLFIQAFVLTDRMQHPTWAFKSGSFPETSFAGLDNGEEIRTEASNAIDEAYIKCDEWLGSVLRNADPSKDVIIIVSDHGFTQGINAEALYGVHRKEGIYLVWGDPVNTVNRREYSENKSPDIHVADITPNILYLMGLPVAKDMEGKVWTDLFDSSWVSAHPGTSIETYNTAEKVKGTMQEVDKSTLEQLRGLGYLDGATNIEGNK
jgi:predicted AlkP superfamily phosphohydrolase/phosphomutase